MTTLREELRATWEDQQAVHEPDRELRFRLMLDHVEHLSGPPLRVLTWPAAPAPSPGRCWTASHPPRSLPLTSIRCCSTWPGTPSPPTTGSRCCPERQRLFAHWSGDLFEREGWHVDLLRRNGFERAGAVWRRGNDAVVVAIRS